MPEQGRFRSGTNSLGRAVWGILKGICPQNSCLQSVLIFGSFRVATIHLLKRRCKENMHRNFSLLCSPQHHYPSGLHYQTALQHQGMSVWAHQKFMFLFLGPAHNLCFTRFVSIVNLGVTKCMGFQSAAYCIANAELTGQVCGAICCHLEGTRKSISYIRTI